MVTLTWIKDYRATLPQTMGADGKPQPNQWQWLDDFLKRVPDRYVVGLVIIGLGIVAMVPSVVGGSIPSAPSASPARSG